MNPRASLDVAQPDFDDLRTSQIAKRAVFRIMGCWGVGNDQARTILGSPSRSTYFQWKKEQGGPLSRDAFERVSYIIGIYKGLQILFPTPANADAWISKPNDAFGGQSALERMSAGNVSDLHAVRAYIDHVRGGRS